MTPSRITFSYDPQRQGYDTTLWKTLTGTPSAVGYTGEMNEFEALTIAESVTVSAATIPNQSINDTASVAESVTVEVV